MRLPRTGLPRWRSVEAGLAFAGLLLATQSPGLPKLTGALCGALVLLGRGEGQGNVVAAEAERVVHGGVQLDLARFARHHVQRYGRVEVLQVEALGNHAVA